MDTGAEGDVKPAAAAAAAGPALEDPVDEATMRSSINGVFDAAAAKARVGLRARPCCAKLKFPAGSTCSSP